MDLLRTPLIGLCLAYPKPESRGWAVAEADHTQRRQVRGRCTAG